jgi:hypothetical protein
MKVVIRLTRSLWSQVHADLDRPHEFAAERVGFLLAAAADIANGVLLLPTRWLPVRDSDYLDVPGAGATIGARAFRGVLENVYGSRLTALHVHRHEHRGRPSFSEVDEESMREFVPGLFNACKNVVHGALVLSRDSATAAIWQRKATAPTRNARFELIGRPLAAWES